MICNEFHNDYRKSCVEWSGLKHSQVFALTLSEDSYLAVCTKHEVSIYSVKTICVLTCKIRLTKEIIATYICQRLNWSPCGQLLLGLFQDSITDESVLIEWEYSSTNELKRFR
jgi:thiamine kinase-like enzyme